MSLKPMERDYVTLVSPPSYEQCAVSTTNPRADYVASPLAMAALFDWDDEDE